VSYSVFFLFGNFATLLALRGSKHCLVLNNVLFNDFGLFFFEVAENNWASFRME